MDEPEIDYIYNDTTCNICFAEFLDLEDLEIHGNQVHSVSVGTLDCQFCAQKLRSIEDYAEHIRDTHLTDIKTCLYCNRVFIKEICCRKHEKKHISGTAAKYKCSQCEVQFTNTVGLGKHEYNAHKEGDATRGMWLGDCLPHLSSVLNMNLNSVLAEDKTKFVCTRCKAVSLTLEDYIQHLKNENCRSLSCNTCASVYKAKKGLLKHFSIHSECYYDTKDLTKKCGECFKDFPLHYWKYHQKSCKTVKCQLCKIVFEKMDDLAQHQTEHHPMVITVEVCKYCQKEFVGKVGLNKHITRTHNIAQYKYKCVYCEMVFKHPKKLFAHFFTKHRDIEPYTCCLCSKSFRVRKSFTIHIKLQHKSEGSVEFDEKFHVFFKEKKDKPNEDKNELDSTEMSENTEAVSEVQTQPESNSKSEEQTSNFLATDTEAPTDNEMQKNDKPQTKKHRQIRSTDSVTSIESSASDSSDDQPLQEIRKKINQQKRNRKKNVTNTLSQNRFTCQYCNKKCYTYHKYHNHLNKAHQNVKVKCVKCLKSFGTRKKLVNHIAKEHSSSKLTETLKKVIAQRRNGNHRSTEMNLTSSEKFQKTIKKVDCGGPEEPAIIKSNSKEISVQKFIENFTPESLELKKNVEISSNVTIKAVCGPTKSSFIKLTKFEPKPNKYRNFRSGNKLAMPLKFKEDRSERTTATVKIVEVAAPLTTYFTDDQDVNDYYDNDNYEHSEEVVEEKHDQIPEVAQEVMLEGSSVEVPKPRSQRVHKVVIPNIPIEMGQVRIATLLPEAPYYKIIKISEVLKNPPNETKDDDTITLPNGKKLVSVNPLAHLLGDTPIEKILSDNKSNKYYQPKRKYNFEQAVAKALMKTPTPKKRRKVTKVEP